MVESWFIPLESGDGPKRLYRLLPPRIRRLKNSSYRWSEGRTAFKISLIATLDASVRTLPVETVCTTIPAILASLANVHCPEEARDTLKDIIIHLQSQVISNLKLAWQEDTHVDFLPLQDVSDASQDRAIMCLIQLQQRLLLAEPIQELQYNSLRPSPSQGFIEPLDSRQPSWKSTAQSIPSSSRSTRHAAIYQDSREPNGGPQKAWAHLPQATPLPSRDGRYAHSHHNFTEKTIHRQASWASTIQPEPLFHSSRHISPPQVPVKSPHNRQAQWSAALPIRSPPVSPPAPRFTAESDTSDSSRVLEIPSKNPARGITLRNPGRESEALEKKPSRIGNILKRQPKVGSGASPRIIDPSAPSPEFIQPLTPPKDRLYDGSLNHLGLGLHTSAEQPGFSRVNSVSTGSTSHSSNEPDQLYGNPWSNTESSSSPRRHPSHSETVQSPTSLYSSLEPDTVPDHGNAQVTNRARPPLPYELSLRHQNSQSSINSWRPSISSGSGSTFQGPPPSLVPTRSDTRSTHNAQNTQSTQSSFHAAMSNTPTGRQGQLPVEDNLAGFCKGMLRIRTNYQSSFFPPTHSLLALIFFSYHPGAWRLQIGEKKKAIEERAKPGSMYVSLSYWKCTKCHFEGRMTKDAQGKSSVDSRIFGSNGVLYRWEFLFKSHVSLKESLTNPLDSTFACLFCCHEGRGNLMFGGVQNFLAHLQEHRSRLPTGAVLYRLKCVIGTPGVGEDFDIALLPV